eukprot:COSAG01_NODE_12569_length_1718_cov_0.974676_5_plen_36_part_01
MIDATLGATACNIMKIYMFVPPPPPPPPPPPLFFPP